jgi:hypothetical protein
MLGLRGAAAGWRLEGACSLGRSSVRLSLRNGAWRLVFYLLPRAARGALAHSSSLALAVEGEAKPSVRRFLAAAARRLGRRSLGDVLRLIEADPLSFVEWIRLHQPGDRVRVPAIGQSLDLLEAGWRNFYADQDFEVLCGAPECAPNGAVVIEYADRECHYARPQRSFKTWSFLDWPEVGKDERTLDLAIESRIVMELGERDIVLGAGKTADAIVAEVRRVAKTGKLLVFAHLCTPLIMGEDFQRLARRCQEKLGGKPVIWSQRERDGNDNLGEHFRSLLGRPGFFGVRPDRRAVNLFHFPEAFRESELEPLLSDMGLRINARVMPEIDLPSLTKLPRALWQVFCERASYPTKVRDLLTRSPLRVVTARAPYGMERTRQCLSDIAEATGKGRVFSRVWRRRMESFRPEWERLREQAKGHRLGFVVSEATAPGLLGLRFGYGPPLAVMAAEMGFGIDLFYYDIHGEEPELPEGLRGAGVTVFRTPWELSQALEAGRCAAVYSDVCFDWRLSRAGKPRFSSRDFEIGLAGARRTLERLLSRCRLPFYRRYARHLAGSPRSAEGAQFVAPE